MDKLTKITLEEIKKCNEESDKYKIIKSKDDKNIIKIQCKEEVHYYLGNLESVESDIVKLKTKLQDINVETLIVIFGLGTGEHVLEILDSVGKFNDIVVFEPDINIIKKFCTLDYADKVLKDSRVSLCMSKKDDLREYFSYCIEQSRVHDLRLLIYPGYEKHYNEELLVFLKEFRYYMDFCIRELLFSSVLSYQVFKSYMKNIKHIIKSIPINLFKDAFNNIPAVIVSAGPSLDKNIEKLKEVQDYFIIICGNRTLRPLLQKNIVPDFLVAVDPTDKIYEHVEDNLECGVNLVFTESTNHKVLENYKGRKIFFKDTSVEDCIEDILGEQIDRLYQAGSVAHPMTNFSVYIGCNPIIFIGQDLAYTNDKQHAECTRNSTDVTVKEDKYVKDIYGNDVLTSGSLFGFKVALEDYIKGEKQNNEELIFINSTEGGANIEGTIVMDLSKSIQGYKKKMKNYDKLDRYKNYIIKRDKNNTVECKERIQSILEKIIYVKNKCKEGISYIEEINDSNDLQKIMDDIMEMYRINDIVENTEELDFINHVLSEVFNTCTNDFKYVENKNETEIDKTKKMANAFKKLYNGIYECIERVEPLIEECISNLNEDIEANL